VTLLTRICLICIAGSRYTGGTHPGSFFFACNAKALAKARPSCPCLRREAWYNHRHQNRSRQLTTVTKIFVVLVCLFAFVFTPLVVGLTAHMTNWKAVAMDLEEQAQNAIAYERGALGIAASATEQYQRRLQTKSDQLLDAQDQIDQLKARVDELVRQRQELDNARASWESSAQKLTAELKVINARNIALTEANERLTKSELELSRRNEQLNDAVAELSAKLVLATEQLKQKVQELTAIRNENEQLRERLQLGSPAQPMTTAETPTVEAASPTAQEEIRGSVIDVDLSQGLASIDVGSAAGVSQGMTMAVIRDGSEYICDLVITEQVDPNQAVGRIKNAGPKHIKAGDTVIDAQSFMQR
jgi:regulator of replication initiation timing